MTEPINLPVVVIVRVQIMSLPECWSIVFGFGFPSFRSIMVGHRVFQTKGKCF